MWHSSNRSNGQFCTEVKFRKSSRSANEFCTEVGFRKSSRSGPQGNCVEVGNTQTEVLVRDSKLVALGEYPVLSFGGDDWNDFLRFLNR